MKNQGFDLSGLRGDLLRIAASTKEESTKRSLAVVIEKVRELSNYIEEKMK